ncbi:hypothetical protein KCU76_g130, partial [Aureobasidium melanogenum]
MVFTKDKSELPFFVTLYKERHDRNSLFVLLKDKLLQPTTTYDHFPPFPRKPRQPRNASNRSTLHRRKLLCLTFQNPRVHTSPCVLRAFRQQPLKILPIVPWGKQQEKGGS